ncbi:MAG: galactose mutarotase [Clostridium sp.]|nr:galactose mutarotase [Clostridium sp.]
MKKLQKRLILPCISSALLGACATTPQSGGPLSGLNADLFADTVNGHATALYTLRSKGGMEVCVTNFGGRVVSIMVPDRNDSLRDVVLGFDNVANYADYTHTPSDFGAAVGRYANRINQGILVIDEDTIQLDKNNFGHCLHGGFQGWQYQIYEAEQPDDSTLRLTMDSPDGDGNFPGAVKAVVTYTLTADNALDIAYEATTTRKTVINMTNHSYFNLSGDPTRPITDHIVWVNADSYTPVDSTYMTTGEIAPVTDTPMDFTEAHEIGRDIRNFDFEQIKNGNGFDHNWCLNTAGDDTQTAARVVCPETGICLEVMTNEPGIQMYTGNFLDGTLTGKRGIVYDQHAGMCLETQKYPDTPNKPEWPSATVEPGETYRSHCIYKFSVVK